MAKILIIEDELTSRKRLEFFISRKGRHKTFIAEDGPEGLGILGEEKPEIVLLDLHMPGMDGLEVLEKIKEKSSHTEVIITTADSAVDSAIQALRMGAFSYIQKPVTYSELEIDIAKALEKVSLDKRLAEYLVNLEQSIEEKNREIERRRRAEKDLQKALGELRNSERHLSSVVQTASDAIISFDKNGNTTFWNQASEKMFGYTFAEIADKPISGIIQENLIDLLRNGKKEADQTDWLSLVGKTVELYGLKRDGSKLPLELSVGSWEIDEGVFFTVILRDISERRQALEQLKFQQQQLIQTDKMASLGTIAAGIAHEINNPLTVSEGDIFLFERDYVRLLGFLEDFLNSSLPGARSERIEKMKEDMGINFILEHGQHKLTRCKDAMIRIHDIVHQLREFSHLDTGKIVFDDINKNIRNTINMIPKKYKAGIEIKTEMALLPDISYNGGQMNQVFMNVLINALQAMKGGGILKVATSFDDDHVLITISDTGTGIPEDKMKRIFEPFYTTKVLGEGTGLGLSISFSIVENHGGKITATNNADKGVTFTIILLRKSSLNLNDLQIRKHEP